MAQDYDQEFKTISLFHQATSKVMKREMAKTIGKILTQIRTATLINAQWTHHLMQFTSWSPAGAGAQLLLLTTLIRDATAARESLLRYTDKFLLIYSILRIKGVPSREYSHLMEIDIDQIQDKAIKNLKRTDTDIQEMEYELKQLEKRVDAEKVCLEEMKGLMKTLDKKLVSIAPNPIGDMYEEIIQRMDMDDNTIGNDNVVPEQPREEEMPVDGTSMSREENLPDEDPVADSGTGKEERRECEQKPSEDLPEEQNLPQDKPLSDEEYMQWLIEQSNQEEVQSDSEIDEFSQQTIPDSHSTQPLDQIPVQTIVANSNTHRDDNSALQLHRDLEQLLHGLYYLPKRKLGETSRGVGDHVQCTFCGLQGAHYSDSCPEMEDSNTRWDYVKRNNICQHCLGECNNADECWSKGRRCWYCDVVDRTILNFLIPRFDGGHHRALCPIPDSKMVIRDHIREIEEEVRALEAGSIAALQQ